MISNIRYYHYLIPNIYCKRQSYFDLLIPFDYSNSKNFIKMIEVSTAPASARKPVFIAYTDSFNAVINPNYVVGSLDYFSSMDYPCLMLFGIIESERKAMLRIGKRIRLSELQGSGEPVSRKNLFRVCQDTSADNWSLRNNLNEEKDDPSYVACDIWCWSDSLKADGEYRSYEKSFLTVIHYIGYVMTVPLDIISSPIQITYLNYKYL